ncbi:Methyltransferase-like protein 25 [Gryllus bimaculatus]|nr:Methyltransferase-like protein 25 [Gryllus bimaculatus]
MKMAEIKLIQSQLDKVISYLQPLLPLANCHMVCLFTENYWSNLVSSDMQNEYNKIGLTGLYRIFGHITKSNSSSSYESDVSELMTSTPHFTEHFSSSRRMCLGFLNDVSLSHSLFQEKLKSWGFEETKNFSINEFMTSKKTHEVEMMSQVVAAISGVSGSSHIVDVGSGKGYLSSMLALQHGLRVLGVDSSQINTHGAAKRSEKLQKYWPGLCRRAVEKREHDVAMKRGKHWKSKSHQTDSFQDNCSTSGDSSLEYCKSTSASLYRQATLYISETSNIEEIVKERFPDETAYSMALVGLHTCGNLAATCLRLFVQNDTIKALCNVGCCYHLIEEEYCRNPFSQEPITLNSEFGFPMSKFLTSKKFALGRNVRMLAAQSVDRLSEKNEIPVTSLFYRALLQVILKHKTGHDRADWQVGRIASKCQNFEEYCNKSIKKLKIDLEITSSEIQEFYDQYKERKDELEAFFLIRVSLAPVIETVIVLDRLLYLVEQGIKEVHIVQLFNPVISPRCYGIIALKDFNCSESKKV